MTTCLGSMVTLNTLTKLCVTQLCILASASSEQLSHIGQLYSGAGHALYVREDRNMSVELYRPQRVMRLVAEVGTGSVIIEVENGTSWVVDETITDSGAYVLDLQGFHVKISSTGDATFTVVQ